MNTLMLFLREVNMKKDIIRVMKDEESGKKIKITEGMVLEYFEAIAQYREGVKKTNQGVFDMILSVGEMIDKKLYLAAGYTNTEEFAIEELGISRRHAYNFYDLYKKLPQQLVQRVALLPKPLSFRRLLALPNDTEVLEGLSESDMEAMAGMSDAEFEAEMAKLRKDDYDRERDGGRGPSDIKRALISRDRYRDQLKKIQRLKEKYDTALNEKDELVGEIEKMEKRVEDLKRVTSPDKNKNELIQENKNLLLKLAELEKLVDADKVLNFVGESGIRYALEAISECSIIFGRLSKIELRSHEQWVEFRAYTETIRQLLETSEEKIAVTMAEKGLHPKEYEQWHDGSFKYHMDKATENMRKDHAEKTEKETDEMIEKAKEDRKTRKKK